MFKSKLLKAFIIGICLSALSSAAVFAEVDAVEPGGGVTGQPAGDSKVLDKQKEIDDYVFYEHVEEIAEKGFKVVYTGPSGAFVEIGITPYSEANAEYLYELFGKDAVKVVESEEAYLMDTAVASAAGSAGDADIMPVMAPNAESSQSGSTVSLMPVYIAAAVLAVGGAAFIARRRLVAGK